MKSHELIAATAFGLEAIVKRELAALDLEGRALSPGRVHFSGTVDAICRANLWLRTADRVLIQVGRFPAADFDALFDTTRSLAWHEWLPRDAAFPVAGRSIKSQLTSVPACQRAVKKAIVEALQAAHGTTTLPETGPTYKMEVALLNDEATLTLDTTGPSLHKRGYREPGAPAPLKETLAAALVQLSFWDRERPLIDPFCGSGTIPIEAAFIGLNRAPGLGRTFAAEDWPAIEAERWEAARESARDAVLEGLPERLLGTDVDERSLRHARASAESAGVARWVHFQQRSFDALSSKRKFGCVIANPPYGRRLGEHGDWEELYRSLPEILRKLPTWSHFILTAYPNFERLVGRDADRRRKLYNGRIECTYYQFHGPRPPRYYEPEPEPADEVETAREPPPAGGVESAGAGEADHSEAAEPVAELASPEREVRRRDPGTLPPVFGGITDKDHEQAELFERRLTKRSRHLRRWPTRQGITCFRIYERDIPEVPLVVDRYEDHLHMTEYERPHDRDPARHADWLDLMVRTAAKALEVDRRKVFLKRRQRQRGTAQHQQLAEQRYEIEVGEGGLKFLVNLSDYVDTGLFLDHRRTRAMVRDSARDARFLNLFGYTGAFSVYAAAGAAAETTTVDWSHTYLDWTQRNLALNGFTGSAHRLVRADARQYVDRLPRLPHFDLVVVDPPTYSNSKRTDDDWDVQRDHTTLLNEVLARMKPGGVLFFSTNFRRFKLDETSLAATEIHDISRQTVPDDFRNQRIHRCWRMVV